MDIKISPSVLSSDLSRLADEVVKMEKAGAHMIHLDVMDGHFVPNITFGAPIIKCLRDKSKIIFDTHLMISNPEQYVDDFINAGSDIITFHFEATQNALELINYIKSRGVKAAISVKPNTAVEQILPYLKKLDMVLIMTVEPGFGGQKFMADMCEKIRKIREISDIDIQVDGGIDNTTIKEAYDAGANIFVSGSYLFNFDDYKEGINSLCKAIES
ncbi:MAG: ribulose-phosphate 3-epimerase [Defluviitaleaceae bacterium]|nr:ribulose-phosphate 3-epimerase [Defluviitaleaceae bacterium]